MYPDSTIRNTFTILDTGDYGFVLTPHFIDVWQGTDTTGGPIYNWCRNTFSKRKKVTLLLSGRLF